MYFACKKAESELSPIAYCQLKTDCYEEELQNLVIGTIKDDSKAILGFGNSKLNLVH